MEDKLTTDDLFAAIAILLSLIGLAWLLVKIYEEEDED